MDYTLETLEDDGEPKEEYPILPNCDIPPIVLEQTEIEYSDRGPNDVVLSGPVTAGWGPGRWFKNRAIAYSWAAWKYGKDRVKPVRERAGRWAFLIKNLKKGN